MSVLYQSERVLSMPDSEAKRKWVKENTTVVAIKLNNNTDSDIIKKLQETANRQGYIKTLIRQDISGVSSIV